MSRPLFRSLFALAATSGYLLLATPNAAAELSLDFESGAVWSDSNEVRIPGDDGTLFSLTDDLRAEDDPAAYLRVRATWHVGDRHDFSVLYAPLSMDYSGEFARPVDFAERTFAADVPTLAHYRFDSYRLTYRYRLFHSEKITFGLGLTAKVRDAEIALSQRGVSAVDDNTGVVPLINFQFQWRFLPDWSFNLEGDALAAPQGRAEDVMAAIQWQATDRLALRLGYRVLEGGADNDDTYAFALFHYLAAGVTFRF